MPTFHTGNICIKQIHDVGAKVYFHVQYNLNGSNPDASFTVADSNSRKQIFKDFFSYFIMELYVVCIH